MSDTTASMLVTFFSAGAFFPIFLTFFAGTAFLTFAFFSAFFAGAIFTPLGAFFTFTFAATDSVF